MSSVAVTIRFSLFIFDLKMACVLSPYLCYRSFRPYVPPSSEWTAASLLVVFQELTASRGCREASAGLRQPSGTEAANNGISLSKGEAIYATKHELSG